MSDVEFYGVRDTVRDELLRLMAASDGTLTPEILVEEARREDSPLHEAFTWDDSVAARLYRLTQAYNLLRAVKVRLEISGEVVTTRAFWPVDGDEDSVRPCQPYRIVTEILAQKDWREELLERAHKEMVAWRKRYAVLKELGPVFAVIDRAALELASDTV